MWQDREVSVLLVYITGNHPLRRHKNERVVMMATSYITRIRSSLFMAPVLSSNWNFEGYFKYVSCYLASYTVTKHRLVLILSEPRKGVNCHRQPRVWDRDAQTTTASHFRYSQRNWRIFTVFCDDGETNNLMGPWPGAIINFASRS